MRSGIGVWRKGRLCFRSWRRVRDRRGPRAVGKQGLEISSADLAMLLDGVDLASVKRQKRDRRIAAMTAQATNESP